MRPKTKQKFKYEVKAKDKVRLQKYNLLTFTKHEMTLLPMTLGNGSFILKPKQDLQEATETSGLRYPVLDNDLKSGRNALAKV